MSMKMGKVVPLMEKTEPAIKNARVISVSEKGVAVSMSGVTKMAQVAFSCLIRPIAGDLVLCAKNETGLYYILSIIERPDDQDMAISFPENLTMQTNGTFTLLSEEAMTLATKDRLNCLSREAIHKSQDATIDVDNVTANGTNFVSNFKTMSVIVHTMNTLARRVIRKAKSYIRHTEDYDQVNAGQMTRDVRGLFSMGTRHTVMVSKKDTKIDGERIHMG